MSAFEGFSPRAVDFYARLRTDNTKQFWNEHKAVYEAEVREPMRALLAELEPEFGSGTVFRPYRDTRFSADKSPYKTHQGAFVGLQPGVGYYVELNAEGLLAGGGFHAHGPDDVERYRRAVDEESAGTALAVIMDELRAAGFGIEGDRLKTQPRGIAPDHPRVELLRYRSLMAVRDFGTPAWLRTRRTVDEVRATWTQLVALSSWCAEHVAGR